MRTTDLILVSAFVAVGLTMPRPAWHTGVEPAMSRRLDVCR
jgi:hypothetical protein